MTAALALIVSALSLALSVYSVWRVRKKESVHAWAEVETTSIANLYAVTVHLQNPTQYLIKFDAIAVPIDRVPLDDRQNFRLLPYLAFRGRSAEWVKENLIPAALGDDSRGFPNQQNSDSMLALGEERHRWAKRSRFLE